METLKQQVERLTDLKRQRETLSFRYYTANDQITVLDLIFHELESWPKHKEIPKYLIIKLSNPEKLGTDNIEDLCIIYRDIILRKIPFKNSH
jgi:hypothetical protein